MIDPTALHAELSTDPLALGYAAKIGADDWLGCAGLLNAKNYTLVGSILVSVFAGWAAQTGMRAAIEDASVNTASPLRSSALAVLDILRGAATSLDLSSSAQGQANIGMLNAWVSAGALTAANEAALMALATSPASRAEVLWGAGTTVSENDVINANFGRTG